MPKKIFRHFAVHIQLAIKKQRADLPLFKEEKPQNPAPVPK